ncbi:ribosomal protein Mrp49 [Schizosaccharomyces cryophilus OY26]|uniref:Ribosomal protein Mrp49 n=1 Tax=Schizosaccharomyces cryophilus (strain OY26 / ATCC MYA-4695 / CBS 11777 / NBRC 106824 / NRRL Y48691) TaxID=653667 RepID=S9X4K1_SCHCR|nr:ribosomal protein Mrp49 [Schizosaccharomyces cryophilus OY26]EPY52002.1 ribosomal protein Mrp49 [Schizosaccharomyces cryophilus OY26]
MPKSFTKIKAILENVSAGQLALPLPKNVVEVRVQYSLNSKNGHMGARKFVKEYLPSLKYHNEHIKFNVDHKLSNEKAPSFSIHTPEGPLFSYGMKLKHSKAISDDIKAELLKLNRPKPEEAS